MKRKEAIVYIRAEVAEQGRVTLLATRAYCETRMRRSSFDDAVSQGLDLFKKKGES